jgi:hypothetical protein
MVSYFRKPKRPRLSRAKQLKLDEASAKFRAFFVPLWDDLHRKGIPWHHRIRVVQEAQNGKVVWESNTDGFDFIHPSMTKENEPDQ